MEPGKKTFDSRELALAAVLAATYAAYVIGFGYVSSAFLQFRVVDALLPLSILFGPPAVAGVTIGAFVGNLFNPFSLGTVDVVGGTIANFVASGMGWWIGRRAFRGAWVTAIAVEIGVVTVVVGSYVVVLTTPGNVPIWVGWLTFLGSEALPIGILGYPLLKTVDRSAISKRFLRARTVS
jgi:uncharacterized membrane protein